MANPSVRPTLGELIHDPGVEAARELAAEVPIERATIIHIPDGAAVRVGTASWTDPTLIRRGVFYPPSANSAEARLRYYASRFPTVEIDSSYYALPSRRNAEAWAARTPAAFRFTAKAFGLFTGQPAEVERLPPRLRRLIPAKHRTKARIYARHLTPELEAEIWRCFLDALEPLKTSGKLAAVLLQYPRWFMPNPESKEAILQAVHRLGDIPAAVEFRNRRWFTPKGTERTLTFLSDHDIPYVMVDEPQGFESSVPPVTAVTSARLAMVRMHGRRRETWEKRGVPPSERYRYLYDKKELAGWVQEIIDAAERVKALYVYHNNCHGNYGTTNATQLTYLLRQGSPVPA